MSVHTVDNLVLVLSYYFVSVLNVKQLRLV
jgi:hypothetical protein